ncbi:hypothetical protein IEQ34_022137 [Dendrobium chrysotoxum]|uniref:Uncharacterized protein n=1 Tax=Dendrobium chrysotoxum TaxID=161865 RepID=A0AAV7FY47_DENCH|nr:hypothetical protein IEQ34_022137 [Dendrobium chrysotoxum]
MGYRRYAPSNWDAASTCEEYATRVECLLPGFALAILACPSLARHQQDGNDIVMVVTKKVLILNEGSIFRGRNS